MAQESIDDLINAVMQAESRGKRFTDGKLTTSTKGAQGEMQVMPKTQRDPGFGVKPAQDNSPEEIARVGKDYLKALVRKFGDTDTALVAYNWGPGNANKWLASGADPSKLPKETQAYLAKVNSNLGTTTAQTAPAKPTTAQATKPVQRVAEAPTPTSPTDHPLLAQLGPNYQAALAISMLADQGEQEGKSEDDESESEKMMKEYMETPARPVALASADLSYQSPFPQPETQPAKLAAGGVPYTPTAGIRPTARAQLNDVKAQWDAYNNQATDYNAKADEYNKQVADYQKLVDAYNAGPRTSAFTGKEPTFTYTAPTQPTTSAEQYQTMADAAKKDAANRNAALSVASDPERFGLSMPKLFADGGDVDYFQDPMGAPSAPITADTFAKGKEFKAADALKAAKEVGKGMVRSGRAIAQGVSETPYNIVGAPVDIATMAMRPFGYSTEAPVGGSDWLKKQALEAGIRQAPPTDPRDLGFYTMGELGSSLVNPGPVAAKVGQATEKAVTTGGKAVAREMLRGLEGQGVLAPVSPQNAIMYAAKPRGGTFLTSGSMDQPPISKLDKTIEVWFDRAAQDAPDAESTKAIRDFFDKKARKYLTTEFGTGADPIRTAIASGELAPIGSDIDRFPEYLLHAARSPEVPGHAHARRDLEKAYDNATTVEGRIMGRHDPADADERRRFNEAIARAEATAGQTMAQEGVPQELQNFRFTGIAGNELGASYNAGLVNAANAPREFPAVAGAVERGQPVYDLGYHTTYMDMFSPKYVAENINAIPPNKLKNMSFADAMIEGSKRMEVSRNYDKAVDLVAKGTNVPKEVVMQFTKPVTATDNGQWVQLTDKLATKMEGKMLHHSVGGYASGDTYGHGGAKAFDSGLARVFSLRDPKTGLAKVTVEGKKLDNGRTEITQIKGDFNSFPEQYKDDLFNFFDHMGYKVSFPNTSEYYRNTPTGAAMDEPVKVNWGKEYERWAQEKPEVPPKKNDSGQSQLPGFYKGGMVERQANPARYI